MSIPSHNGSVTDRCLVCGGSLPPGRPRTTCSDRCRQTAWRRRHQSSPLPVKNLPTARRIKDHTVYQCPPATPACLASNAATTATSSVAASAQAGNARANRGGLPRPNLHQNQGDSR